MGKSCGKQPRFAGYVTGSCLLGVLLGCVLCVLSAPVFAGGASVDADSSSNKSGACVSSSTRMCLRDDRFSVEVEWTDFDGDTGPGRVASFGTDESGVFWFFGPNNLEFLVKVLDACTFNDRFWIFASATTNVGYTLTVTDTAAGQQAVYTNPLGTLAPAIADTDAFATCAIPSGPLGAPHGSPFSWESSAGCAPSSTRHCFRDGRFKLEVNWRDFDGNTGPGRVVPYGTDESGLFWFFGANNWEMLVKVLDACSFNERFWVFSAATTNVEYDLTVTDTVTGDSKTYHNSLGQRADAIGDTQAFATCDADSDPPTAPGPTTSPSCVSMQGNTCMVNDEDFTLQVTPATDPPGGSGIDPDGYRVCRSINTAGNAACSVTITNDSTVSYVVSGNHRPPPGARRAYYFMARDNAGNLGPANVPLYVQTIVPPVDNDPPSAPGATTSPDCVVVENGTCFVVDENFTIEVTPAVDNPGGSGVDPDGYTVCRSSNTTTTGNCSVTLSENSTVSYLVSGAHRPPPGMRRAYYFRASDNVGNNGPLNTPLYVQTLEPPGQELCLDSFYSSIQQGNSNRLPAAHEPDPFRPANDLRHYHDFVMREGSGAVKVWDATLGVGSQQFADLMYDPDVDVVVYRPMYNFNNTTKDEQVDYGGLAVELYERYHNVSKVVILTGWEQDHQLNAMMTNIPGFTVSDYRDYVQDRQDGVTAARESAQVPGCVTCPIRLSVFHNAEVVQSNGPVLNQVIAQMTPRPDFVSYSAWGGLGDPAARLNNIQKVSGLPRDRIFVGEYGYRIDLHPENAAALNRNFVQKVRAWGAHMAFLWQFNQGVQLERYVVYGEPEHDTPVGFVRENSHPLGSVPVKRDVIDAVLGEGQAAPCSPWAWSSQPRGGGDVGIKPRGK